MRSGRGSNEQCRRGDLHGGQAMASRATGMGKALLGKNNAAEGDVGWGDGMMDGGRAGEERGMGSSPCPGNGADDAPYRGAGPSERRLAFHPTAGPARIGEVE